MKSIERSIRIREDFMDRPHRKKEKVSWSWPKQFQAVGSCEAVMYSSDKWQKDGSKRDYKHIKEGPQDLLIPRNVLRDGHKDSPLKTYGPTLRIVDFPDTFAFLADCIGVQACLYCDEEETLGDYYQIDFPRSKVGAGEFADGSTFIFVYSKSGVHAVVLGSKLRVLKDGIVG